MLTQNIPQRFGKYRVLNIVGQGAYSTVVKALNEKTSEIFAIKVIDRQMVTNSGMMRYLDTELRILERISHPSLIKVYEILYEEKFILIVMEFLPHGNIVDIYENRIFFSLKERLEICIKILQGLNFLHDHGIAHRDIKPENIMFDVENNPKIIDFGLSCDRNCLKKTLCGSKLYMAPEVMRGDKYNGFKADIWSLGVTFHLFMSNELPFDYNSEAKLLREVRNGRLCLKNKTNGPIKEIINKMLDLDPENRPTVKELIEMFNLFRPTVEKKLTLPRITFKPEQSKINRARTDDVSFRIFGLKHRINSIGSL